MAGVLPLGPLLLSTFLPPSPHPKGWSIRHPASACLCGNRWKLHVLNKTAAPGLELLSPVYAPNLPSGEGGSLPRLAVPAGVGQKAPTGRVFAGWLAPLSDLSGG